ncbi:hypothetical protein pdam_00023686, partial [Pocillopora damicornis]
MATAAAPSFHSTKETTNYARLCRLLVGVSAHILRETFDKRRPPGNLDTVLSCPSIYRLLKLLRIKKVLNPSQWDKLYPAIKSPVSSRNFDITILMVLLRNICGLAPPVTGWDTLPLATDTTLEADFARIKCYRNTVYGHASEASVDDVTFNQYWQDIQDALVRLGGAGYQSAINDLKKECMDPDIEEHFKELLKQWVVDEVSIKERLDEIGKSLDKLKEAIVNPKKRAGDKAVAEYSDALKESIKSQTEYFAQASPTMSNVRTDHIFTNILMQHGRKPVKDLDAKRNERLRQYGQISGKQIKSSQEIFIPTDGKHPESVLVTGKAGIGKSLFCQKLIKDWADNKLFQSRANAEVPDFKFAYLLTFRQLNLLGDDPVTLKDILNRSSVLDDHSNIDNSIFEYIRHHSEEVLIIIDGYDECSQREYIASDSDEKYPNNAKEEMPVAALCAKLIKGKILRGSVVIITSRPDESDEMKAKEIYFDRYVEITGFSEPQQPKKNNPLPVKTSDLYDEVVHMFVQKHDRKKSASTRKIPPGDVSTEVVLFMSGILSKEEDNEFVKKLIIKKILSVPLTNITTKGLLISKCLLEYEDIEFSKKIVKEFRNVFCPRVGHFGLSGFGRANVDCIAVSFALNVFGALNAEDEPEWSRITTLSLSDQNVANFASLCQELQTPTCKVTNLHLNNNHITDAGVASLCQALQTPACKVTELELGCNQITDAGVASLCQALQTSSCRVTTLLLCGNQITDAGVASLCQALQTPACKVIELYLYDNQITDAGVASLSQALQTLSCKVSELDLGYNQITDAGVASLCQALQTPTCKVTVLQLNENWITDTGVASLCQALQTPSCKVFTLNLYGNQITDAGVASLCQALWTPTCKVIELYLNHNQITDAGVASLSQALQTPT